MATFNIFDALVVNGAGIFPGSTLSVAAFDFFDVLNGIQFTDGGTGDENAVTVGDTAQIYGGTWTVSEITNIEGEFIHNGGFTTNFILTSGITLTNDDGETLDLIVPRDVNREIENIQEFNISSVSPATSHAASTMDDFQGIDLGSPDDGLMYVVYDAILIDRPTDEATNGGSSVTTTLTPGDGLVRVDDRQVFNVSDDSGTIRLNDTTVIDGVTYYVVGAFNPFVNVSIEGGSDQSIDAIQIFLSTTPHDGSSGNPPYEMSYVIPNDIAGSWAITSMDIQASDGFPMGNAAPMGQYNENDGVTLSDTAPCFTPGTMIKTKKGEVDVAKLKVGDMVLTKDNGYRPIRWIGRRDLSPGELTQIKSLRPILIRKDALAPGLPSRDLRVSPQHRMLMGNAATEMCFGVSEVLVAAKHLTPITGVEVENVANVSYIHMMFDDHEIVSAEGAWSESFQPGAQTVEGLDDAAKAELFALFPELDCADPEHLYPAARVTLKEYEAAMLQVA